MGFARLVTKDKSAFIGTKTTRVSGRSIDATFIVTFVIKTHRFGTIETALTIERRWPHICCENNDRNSISIHWTNASGVI